MQGSRRTVDPRSDFLAGFTMTDEVSGKVFVWTADAPEVIRVFADRSSLHRPIGQITGVLVNERINMPSWWEMTHKITTYLNNGS